MEWADNQWEELQSTLESLATLLPIDCQEFVFDSDSCKAECMEGLVTIEPLAYESKSIQGIKEKPGWLVTLWKWTDETDTTSSDFVRYKEIQTTETSHATMLTMLYVWELIVSDHLRNQS
jgi:hypothetical protein